MPDEALRLVAEVLTVAPSEAVLQSGQQEGTPPSRPAAPAEAAPAPIETPPPPPPAATLVSEGQTIDQVTAAWGQPLKKAKVGAKDIYYYKDMKVTFVDGKVKDVE
jgi:hypothetical protein